MKLIQPYSLEQYVERHRADFDLHEPRPELWAALETQLHGQEPAAETPQMSIAPATQPTAELLAKPAVAAPTGSHWQWYGIAAALAALLVAAGVGENWKSTHRPTQVATSRAATVSAPTDAALYVGPTAASMLVAQPTGTDVDARLDTAVHGMERYYVAQLNDRKTQLSQLAPAATAEWARELIGLDSSYQQLKRELPQHPQPEVVLTAMNRNLQIRLDILDRQLELHGRDQTALAASPSSEFVLADSRVVADNEGRRHEQ